MIKIFCKSFLIYFILFFQLSTSVLAQTEKAQEPTVQGIGYVEPVNQVLRLNFKSPGIIAEILVNVGQEVKKGALLARKNNDEEQALLALEQATLELARAEAEQLQAGINPAKINAQQTAVIAKKAVSDYSKLQAQRFNNLAASNSVPIAHKDQAVSEAEHSEAELKAAQAELRYLQDYVRPVDQTVAIAKVHIAQSKVKLQQVLLAETELHAPSDGTILEINKHSGDNADASESVMLFADTSKLQVRAELDEDFALLLKAGQRVSIYARGAEQKAILGTITQVNPIMGKKTIFARTTTERKDVDVRQVLVRLPEKSELPIGLETDVTVELNNQ